MKSFKNYVSAESEGNKQESMDVEALGKKLADTYNGKSNADMWRSILAEAEKSKRAGTLSNEEIENFYNTFSPMLDTAQRNRLRTVVEKLKKI